MNWNNRPLQRALWSAGLSGLVVTLGLLASPLGADARPLGKPKGINMTGAVRGTCTEVNPNQKHRLMIGLVDHNDPTLTLSERPTFWLHIPFQRSEDLTQIEFELLDENDQPVLQKRKIVLDLPAQPGLARFTIPASEKALEVGKEYFWTFRVICDPQDSSGNPKISGWIKRVAPNDTLTQQLQRTPSPLQYQVYAEQHLWHEQVTQLAEYRTQDARDWSKLLKGFGLEDLAQSAIADLQINIPAPTASSSDEEQDQDSMSIRRD